MNIEQFWEVIGNYNRDTWKIQVVFLFIIVASIVVAYLKKAQWLPKITLGITNLFIGIVFFLTYGTEPIQTFFAAPLYIAIGLLFLWEGIKHQCDKFSIFSKLQWVLFLLVALYPAISLLLGNSFPEMVVYIMPCPVISLSIVVYSFYGHKNKLLLALLTIWGLTGIKSFFFNVLEDAILLTCGIYCLYILIGEFKIRKLT